MINIYKITCETGKVYYGSTKQTLKKRLQAHKDKNNCSCKDFINPKIELLETCNEEERYRKEGEYIRNFECVNVRIAGRTISERKKIYYDKVKDTLEHKQKMHIRYEKYKEKHKEKKNETARVSYAKNKEKITEKRKEKITCECGSIIGNSCLTRHKKSKKHLEHLKNHT